MQDQTSILITSPTRQRSRPITPLQLSATCICITCVLTAHVFHLLLWNQSSMYLSVHVQGVPMHVPLMFDYEPRETKAQMHYLEVARWWLRGIPRSTRWEHLSGRVKGSCTRGRRSGSACLQSFRPKPHRVSTYRYWDTYTDTHQINPIHNSVPSPVRNILLFLFYQIKWTCIRHPIPHQQTATIIHMSLDRLRLALASTESLEPPKKAPIFLFQSQIPHAPSNPHSDCSSLATRLDLATKRRRCLQTCHPANKTARKSCHRIRGVPQEPRGEETARNVREPTGGKK